MPPAIDSPFSLTPGDAVEQTPTETKETPAQPESADGVDAGQVPKEEVSLEQAEADEGVHRKMPRANARLREETKAGVAASFLDRLLGKKKEEAEVEGKEAEKTEEKEEKPKPEKAEVEEEKPVKPKKAKRESVAKPLTEADMVRVATQAAAEAQERWRPIQETPKPEAPPEPDLPSEIAGDMPVYRRLAESKPDKYGKLVAQIGEFAKKQENYRKEWLASNPNETFDPKAPEHEEFFERNFPTVNEGDFDGAKEDMMEERAAERAAAKLAKEYEPQFKALAQERAEVTLRPKIEATLKAGITEILSAIDPKYAPLAESLEKMQGLGKTNKMAADVAEKVCVEKMPLLVEVRKMHLPDGKGGWVFPFDEKNDAHLELRKIAADAEKTIRGFPEEDRLDGEGRAFATRAQYSAMTPDQREQHWFLDEEHLTLVVLGEMRKQAKDEYSKKRKEFERYGGKVEDGESSEMPTSQDKKPVLEEDPRKVLYGNKKPESPSVGGRAPVVGSTNGKDKDGDSVNSIFFSRLGLK